MQSKRKLVHGVGINDSDYKTYSVVSHDLDRKTKRSCPFYEVWRAMLRRCYSEKYHKDFPTYSECEVIPSWLYFSQFRRWMESQDWKGKHLDKDILGSGSKVYSPDNCVFVAGSLNLFLTGNNANRGKHPIGVSWNKAAKKFRASCCNPFTGKEEHIGLFSDQEAAHEAWRAKKHEHACAYADQQTDQRIAQALRTRYAKKAAQ